ncbi:hypothetical protein TWF694_008781 [Orbilia ellipsospora]|uniref:F-box domain-containing protein n=1 Tax=Orbilia ellipsospora TaxID=2528407 RepID=A0AAV9XG61_9PEZI
MRTATHFPLLEFLSNDYLLMQTCPYFLPHETLNLALCSKNFYNLLFHTPGVFRHVDISLSSVVPTNQPQHQIVLRRNSIDILSSRLLGRNTQTLILDGLPMNFDKLTNLLLSPNQRISILSVRDCALNQPVFMQTLHFLVRPGSTSPLKGVYMFNKSNGKARSKNKWQRIRYGEIEFIEGWAETVLACEGKILFDVGICKGSKHMSFQPLEDGTNVSAAAEIELGSTPVSVQSGFSAFAWSANDSEQSSVTSTSAGEDSWIPPQMAPKLATKTIRGSCEGCKMPPVGCTSKLYAPVPVLTSDIKVACRPRLGETEEVSMCEDCTKERLCEGCGKWWCENCYDAGMGRVCGIQKGGVLLDCYDCGRTCYDCKKDTLRECRGCRGNFCAAHDVSGSELYCDWCYK